MNRIENAFSNGKSFIGFLTAGDPTLDKTENFILAMEEAGADLIEIGIPFSDPVAEGPVIEAANARALAAGATVEKVFKMVENVRKQTNIPLVFLTYLNPVFRYGYDAFMAKCQQVGIDGIIIPDLPYEEQDELRTSARDHQVSLISLLAPTSNERSKKIAQQADGFLYIVSSLGVTGIRQEITTDLPTMVAAVRSVTNVPTAIGFGINTPEQAKKMSEIADGVIVGSAIVDIIAKHQHEAASHLTTYVRKMKEAIQ